MSKIVGGDKFFLMIGIVICFFELLFWSGRWGCYLHVKLKVRSLTDADREKLSLLTSRTRRNLFLEGDEATSRTQRENQIEFGMITAIEQIAVKIPLPGSPILRRGKELLSE